MNKAYNMKKSLFFLFTVVCLFIFNSGCGLDVLYLIESPIQTGGTPDQYSQYPDRFFEFRTNENSNIEGLRIRGTDVYYKIYDSVDRLISDVSYINNTDNNSSSKDKLISGGKNYQKLRASGHSDEPLIQNSGLNKNIRIRLTSYQNISSMSANIYVDDTIFGIPVRDISDMTGYTKDFNFGRTGVRKPVSGDSDSYITSSSSAGIYYVSMYAVTIGQDASYTNYYSEPLYLGYVKIDSNTPDN